MPTNAVSGSILLALNKAKMGLGLGDPGSEQLATFGGGMPSFGGSPTSDPTSALSYAYQDNPLGRFAFQTVTDPLNLVGLGLPEKLAATGLMKAIPFADRALGAAGVVDRLPGAATDAALGAGKDLVWGGLQHPLSAIQPSLEDFAASHSGLVNGWQDVTRGWKALQHMVPSFPLSTNLDT